MKIGVVYPQIELGGDPAAVGKFARAAEALGYAHIYAYDHVLGAPHDDREPPLTGPYTERDPFHDPMVMFGYIAGVTSKIEMGTHILILPQRQTALVARQAADVDLLSGGRLRLGVGTGWNYVEYDSLNEDYATRGRRMTEQVTVLRRLWTGGIVDFAGDFHRIDRAALNPPPARQIPIWMGGRTEVSWRRAARIGDGYMFNWKVSRSVAGWNFIQEEMRKAGREPETFGRDFTIEPKRIDEVYDDASRWRDAGGSHATVGTIGRGLATVEAHIDFIAQMKARLDQGGL